MTENAGRDAICEVGRRLWQRGYVAANDGNISIRLDESRLLATPTGVSKGFMHPEMLVLTDLDGAVLSGGRPSSELKMHLAAYRLRPDVRAIVHAHPPTATGFAASGRDLMAPVMPETIYNLGGVPLAPYATPSTAEVPEAVIPLLPRHDAILLANHGALALGSDLWEAYEKMETIEHTACILLVAHQLGGPCVLPPKKIRQLLALKYSTTEKESR